MLKTSTLLAIFHSKTAQAIGTWFGILSTVFGVLIYLTPEWFGTLTVTQAILLAIGFGFAAALASSITVLIAGLGFRSFKPLSTAPQMVGEPDRSPAIDHAAVEGGKIRLTTKEKGQAKDILVDLADLIRDKWVPVIENSRWLYGAQDVYAASVDKLPALKKQTNKAAREIQEFQAQHNHMLSVMGVDLNEHCKAAYEMEGRIQDYIGRVQAVTERSDAALQLLQSLAQPVRDARQSFDALVSHLERTVTRMRKEVDQ